VFSVVIPDNMKAIVTAADAVEPRLNDSFREYAQSGLRDRPGAGPQPER